MTKGCYITTASLPQTDTLKLDTPTSYRPPASNQSRPTSGRSQSRFVNRPTSAKPPSQPSSARQTSARPTSARPISVRLTTARPISARSTQSTPRPGSDKPSIPATNAELKFLHDDGTIRRKYPRLLDRRESHDNSASSTKFQRLCKGQKAWFKTGAQPETKGIPLVDETRSNTDVINLNWSYPSTRIRSAKLDETRRNLMPLCDDVIEPRRRLHSAPPGGSVTDECESDKTGAPDVCGRGKGGTDGRSVVTDWRREREQRRAVRRRMKMIMRSFIFAFRVFSKMIDRSVDMTQRSAVEMQWHTLHASSEVKKLAFNKFLYTRERNQTRVPRWALSLFAKSPHERTETDCRKIHALLRGLKSFDNFTERIQMAMCRAFSYDCVDSMRVVLRKGHVGVNFYFIYSGSVFVNVEDFTKSGEKFIKTEVILIRGDSFGELALLQDTRRNATVTVREQCEFLTVDKYVFSEICPQIFDTELREKVLFIKEMPLFRHKGWGLIKLTALCSQAQIQEYKTNKIVTMDSLSDEWMYICMQGKCRVIRHMSMAHIREDHVAPSVGRSRRNSACEGKVGTPRYRPQTPDSDRTDAMRERAFERTKSRLLESMNLDYLPHTTINSMISAVEREFDETIEDKPKLDKSITTLTSLMTSQGSNPQFKDYVYIEFADLQPGDVFDLCGIMDHRRKLRNGEVLQREGSVILVSAGAKMVKVKKSMFFNASKPDAMTHAYNLSTHNRFPADAVLIQSFKEKSLWDRYRLCTTNDSVRQISERKNTAYIPRIEGTHLINHHSLLRSATAKSSKSVQKNDERSWIHSLTLQKPIECTEIESMGNAISIFVDPGSDCGDSSVYTARSLGEGRTTARSGLGEGRTSELPSRGEIPNGQVSGKPSNLGCLSERSCTGQMFSERSQNTPRLCEGERSNERSCTGQMFSERPQNTPRLCEGERSNERSCTGQMFSERSQNIPRLCEGERSNERSCQVQRSCECEFSSDRPYTEMSGETLYPDSQVTSVSRYTERVGNIQTWKSCMAPEGESVDNRSNYDIAKCSFKDMDSLSTFRSLGDIPECETDLLCDSVYIDSDYRLTEYGICDRLDGYESSVCDIGDGEKDSVCGIGDGEKNSVCGTDYGGKESVCERGNGGEASVCDKERQGMSVCERGDGQETVYHKHDHYATDAGISGTTTKVDYSVCDLADRNKERGNIGNEKRLDFSDITNLKQHDICETDRKQSFYRSLDKKGSDKLDGCITDQKLNTICDKADRKYSHFMTYQPEYDVYDSCDTVNRKQDISTDKCRITEKSSAKANHDRPSKHKVVFDSYSYIPTLWLE